MSEPSSLYVSIEIKKEKLEAFLKAQSKPLAVNIDVLAWWKSREMHSPTDIATVPQNHLHYPYATNGTLIKNFVTDQRFGASQQYHDAAQIWTFILLQFSENFLEILPMISFFKQLATYQSQAEKGTAIIYDFLWGDGTVMAHLDFSGRQATLTKVSKTAAIDSEIAEKANKSLQHVLDKLNEQYEG
ncbi:hypothetical protein [Sinomicrobium sp. M5D2P9]